MNSCCRVTLHVAESDGALLHVDSDNAAALSIGGEIYSVETPPYEGAYEATPSQETQVFATAGKRIEENFTVNPIPWYYGLITYNGSTITVS